jgi:hypothetical protein
MQETTLVKERGYHPSVDIDREREGDGERKERDIRLTHVHCRMQRLAIRCSTTPLCYELSRKGAWSLKHAVTFSRGSQCGVFSNPANRGCFNSEYAPKQPGSLQTHVFSVPTRRT